MYLQYRGTFVLHVRHRRLQIERVALFTNLVSADVFVRNVLCV